MADITLVPEDREALHALYLSESEAWRKRTGEISRHEAGVQPEDVSVDERRRELAIAQREMRHLLGGSVISAEARWIAAEVVSRDRPVTTRELDLVEPVKGRTNGAYAASMALRGLGR